MYSNSEVVYEKTQELRYMEILLKKSAYLFNMPINLFIL